MITAYRQQGCLRQANERAFSLIELLVVVAVLALLLAILSPALRKAKDISRRLACSSNLRQIAVASQVYLEDYGGRFYKGRSANTGYGGWQGPLSEPGPRPLNPYLGLPEVVESAEQAEVFRCPGDDGSTSSSAMRYFDEIGTSYQTNEFLIGDYSVWLWDPILMDAVNELVRETRMHQIGNPSEILLLGDFDWYMQWIPEAPEGDVWHRRLRHFSMVFVDTHTELLEIRKGLLIGPGYRILPFPELYDQACKAQKDLTPVPEPEP